MPNFKELGTNNLMACAKEDPEVMKYIPNEFFENPKASIPKTFLVNIINTVRPDFIKRVVTDARQNRMPTKGLARDRFVEVAPEFA